MTLFRLREMLRLLMQPSFWNLPIGDRWARGNSNASMDNALIQVASAAVEIPLLLLVLVVVLVLAIENEEEDEDEDEDDL